MNGVLALRTFSVHEHAGNQCLGGGCCHERASSRAEQAGDDHQELPDVLFLFHTEQQIAVSVILLLESIHFVPQKERTQI